MHKAVTMLATTFLTASALLVAAPSTPAEAAGDCSTMSSPIGQAVNPSTSTNILSPWPSEISIAGDRYGYTDDLGTPFKAALTQLGGGDVQVHRAYRQGDFKWFVGDEGAREAAEAGYTVQKVEFRASSSAGTGCAAVNQFERGGKHRVALASDAAELTSDGWRDLGTAFYAAADVQAGTPEPPTTPEPPVTPEPPAGGDTFSLAVLPDTQTWVLPGSKRFSNATQWLAENKEKENLQYVLHTGDVTNWGWVAPDQLKSLDNAMGNLERAGIPYQLSAGNHDTAAVGWDGKEGSRGYGGYAYVGNPECVEKLSEAECKTNLLVRDTDEFNQVITAESSRSNGQQFESGKTENSYSTFTAGGRKWLTMNLEYMPRESVVKWAQGVVSKYSDHNVIVQTHFYLNGDGSIVGSAGGYGSTTGKYLYDNLIGKYANIRLVFSGHVGSAAAREDVGQNGNKIVSMVQNDVTGNSANAMRLVRINGKTGEVSTRIFAEDTGYDYTQYDRKWVLSLR